MIVLTQRLAPGAPVGLSRLTFTRYGETIFLDSIKASGQSYASRIPSDESDRRQRGRAQAAPQMVSLTYK